MPFGLPVLGSQYSKYNEYVPDTSMEGAVMICFMIVLPAANSSISLCTKTC